MRQGICVDRQWRAVTAFSIYGRQSLAFNYKVKEKRWRPLNHAEKRRLCRIAAQFRVVAPNSFSNPLVDDIWSKRLYVADSYISVANCVNAISKQLNSTGTGFNRKGLLRVRDAYMNFLSDRVGSFTAWSWDRFQNKYIAPELRATDRQFAYDSLGSLSRVLGYSAA